MANANDKTTEVTSITPNDLELFRCYLQYRDIKKQQQQNNRNKPKKYRITIELDVISSNSEEYSEAYSENETDEQTEPEFTDDDVQKDGDDVQKDTEDVENSLKNCCA